MILMASSTSAYMIVVVNNMPMIAGVRGAISTPPIASEVMTAASEQEAISMTLAGCDRQKWSRSRST